MGREIVYCEGCGKRLTEDDFSRGKAQDHDNRPFCSDCKPVTAPPPPPSSQTKERTTERRSGGTSSARRRGSTERMPFAQPPPPSPARRASEAGANKHIGLYVAGGLAALVLIVVAVSMNGRSPSVAPADSGVPPKPPSESRLPAVNPAEERLRDLEAFAAANAADPQTVLARCEQARAVLRGPPFEARFRRIEEQAQERLKEKDRAAELDRALASIRRIIQDDVEYARRKEVEALLESALKIAGPRSPEVQKLQSDYRTLCEDAAKRVEEAKRLEEQKKQADTKKRDEQLAATKKWMDLFTQATNKTGANDYPGAKLIFLEALPLLPETRPEDIAQRAVYCIGLYNLACIYSVEAEKLADKAQRQAIDEAFKHLERSLRGDYGRFRCPCHPQTLGIGHMGEDKDLILVRKDPRYADLLKKFKP